MSRVAIKDSKFRIIGYIETMSDGKQKAMDAKFSPLGYYDPKRDITQDQKFKTIAHGNVLSGLIYK